MPMAICEHILVESGPEKGRHIQVPANGVRIGRSSKNDVSLNDPSLSRFHCRLYFDEGGDLWISDLGSANGTLVNDAPVEERKLLAGDLCSLGETTMRVLHARSEGEGITPREGSDAPEPAINLGFGRESRGAGKRDLRQWLLAGLGCMAAISILAWVPWKRLFPLFRAAPQAEDVAPGPQETFPLFDVFFERVEGSTANIFRYSMSLKEGLLVVQVDDLAAGRHVRRERKVAPELLEDLSRICEQAGFFDLLSRYAGVSSGVHESTDLSVTSGRRTHRVLVVNHVEPDAVARIRGQLEEFSKNELGLAALAIPPDELKRKANESYLLGMKLVDEREVDAGNLSRAIRAFTEAEWYLETIEPKPEFYGDTLRQRAECDRELQKRYDNLWFIAERSVKLRDWKEAAVHLRGVCDLIPDRSDDRHRNAYKKLVDVERRIATEKTP